MSVVPAVVYYVLMIGQTLLGLYGDQAVCLRAAEQTPGSQCMVRELP